MAESNDPSSKRSAKEPSAWSPTWPTTPVPWGSTTSRRVAVAFTLEMPVLVGGLLRREQQFPLPGGHFRGREAVSSGGLVNDRG